MTDLQEFNRAVQALGANIERFRNSADRLKKVLAEMNDKLADPKQEGDPDRTSPPAEREDLS